MTLLVDYQICDSLLVYLFLLKYILKCHQEIFSSSPFIFCSCCIRWKMVSFLDFSYIRLLRLDDGGFYPLYLVTSNPHAKKLYDDLMSNYNRLIRPVSNNTDKLTVKIRLKLSQLIDVVSWSSLHLYNSMLRTHFNWIVSGPEESSDDHQCLGGAGKAMKWNSPPTHWMSERKCLCFDYWQTWNDFKLRWDPQEYGGVDTLYVPAKHIWLPDIVLFNK